MYEFSIIREVQKHPLIYNRFDPEFRNKISREEAWKEVSLSVGISVDQCQARWRSLRDRFVKEVNRKDAPLEGEQRWRYYDTMLFLKDFVIKGKNGFEECLISEVQKYPCLYDKKDPDHGAKLIREEAWERISAVVGAPIEHCRGRWRTLRDRFLIETNKTTHSSWAYMEPMEFMNEYISQKRTLQHLMDETLDGINSDEETSQVMFKSEESMPIEFENPLEIEVPTSSGQKRKATEDPNSSFLKVMKKIESVLDKRFNDERREEEEDPFHKYIDSLLSKVHEETRETIKVEIINLVSKRVQECRNKRPISYKYDSY